MQMGSNEFFYRNLGLPFEYDVSFVGQKYADRGDIFKELVDSQINAHAFGPKWLDEDAIGNHSFMDMVDKIYTINSKNGIRYTSKYILKKIQKKIRDRGHDSSLLGHIGGVLSDQQIVEVFNKSKINLGFSTVYLEGREGGESLDHLRLRDFEIPMSGGFYLTKYSEEIEKYFDVGKEIACYSSRDDLIDKCNFYLKNSTAREKIRLAGLDRSRKCHTWEQRFNQLFSAPKILDLIT
jgi:spore maturation protein CgeB